jgi:flavoprotein hydroxylase
VGRILQSCGIGDALRAITDPAEVYEWRNASGTTLLRFGRVGLSRSGWPESSMFSQPELEALLDARVRSLPTVDVRRGVEVTSLVQREGHVAVGDAAGRTVHARYAVGCDGANSTVRGLAGLGVHDLGFFYDWLIVDVMLDQPRVFDPMNLQICDPRRPTTAVSGGPGRRRWEFMRLPEETIDELDDEATAWDLLQPWDVHRGNARLERHAVYTFQARYAEQWRDRRVLIAGDAAHQMPPFAGQGMCAGLRDAANLAWKLDLVLAGSADDTLLDSYEVERLPSARQAIELSMQLGQVICVADPAAAAARDAAMAATVTDDLALAPDLPGITDGVLDADDPQAGQLFGQCRVGGSLFDDVHGAGWRLVTSAADVGDLDAGVAAWFESIGGRVVALDALAIDDEWWSGSGAAWRLQRPDFHLFGSATDAATATCLLIRLRDRLTAGASIHGGTPS